ncbi:TPA: shufflon protein D', partial [Escherichia coli]|nr:shufflon protein D' [Escherichia coli]
MLTSKEAKNNANNHSLQACQSGTWRKSNSGSTVITGRIANGQQIPLPTGFSASQCSWSVSNAENPQGWKPNYFAGSVATYDANRIVKCGFYDEYNFHKGTFRADLTGKCSYVVA